MRVEERIEKYIRKYRPSDGADITEQMACFLLFCKNVLNFVPRPHQIMDVEQMLKHSWILNVKPSRAGKTMGMEALGLWENVIWDKQNYNIYAPKADVGKEALNYHLEWIEQSPMLTDFIRILNGKKQKNTGYYEFRNRSWAKARSVAAKTIEGHNSTCSRVEEIDDMDWETFQNRITRRMGAMNEDGSETKLRISGTIMGQENIYNIKTSEKISRLYTSLMETPYDNMLGIEGGIPYDAYTMFELGALDARVILAAKEQMTDDEWLRTYMLKFTESKNFIWSRYFRAVQKKSNDWGMKAEPVRIGEKKRFKGTVAIGLDCGHAGEKKGSSYFSLQVMEQLGPYRRWLMGYKWPSTVDLTKLVKEVIEICEYYQPAGGYGDALLYNTIADINDMAFKAGFISNDRSTKAENKSSNWNEWWLVPLRNNGENKDKFYKSLRLGIHKCKTYFPLYKEYGSSEEAKALNDLKRSILNIRTEKTAHGYLSYKRSNDKISDDPADAIGMCNWWLDQHVEPEVNWDLINPSSGGIVQVSNF